MRTEIQTIEEIMEQIVSLNETEKKILIQIAESLESVSPYDLVDIIGRSYFIIHSACKRLKSINLVELKETISNKGGKKTQYYINLAGLCVYFSVKESERINKYANDPQFIPYIINDDSHFMSIFEIFNRYQKFDEIIQKVVIFCAKDRIQSDINKLSKNDENHFKYFLLNMLWEVCRDIGDLDSNIRNEHYFFEFTNNHIKFIYKNISEYLYDEIRDEALLEDHFQLIINYLSSNQKFKIEFESFLSFYLHDCIEGIKTCSRFLDPELKKFVKSSEFELFERHINTHMFRLSNKICG